MLAGNRILIIHSDDQLSNQIKERLIGGGGYFVITENSGKKALETLKKSKFDLIITSFAMPDSKGESLIKDIKSLESISVVILILDERLSKSYNDIYKLGVYDVISRPISYDRLFFLIRNGIDLHSLHLSSHRLNYILQEQNITLQKQNTILAKRIEESTKNLTKLYEDLRATYLRTIKALAQAIDARDHYTHRHSENVARYAVEIAKVMGLSLEEIDVIRQASELHDLGKIGIEDSILLKPSSLTDEEFAKVKNHPITGAQILEPLTFLSSVVDLVKYHHEHFDGSGYPEGKKGDDIPFGARILHLADAYEAMTSARAYRRIPLSRDDAVNEIKKFTGFQFDPQVVEAFLRVVDKF
ncbi:MAG: HD domain-containing phosphohydrolase [Candidatus Omnitrophota bacterium]